MDVKRDRILQLSLMTIALIIMFIFILHVAKPFLLPFFSVFLFHFYVAR